jgi:LmbE family N-acetylglucosaminyl deacetylase
MFEIWTPLRRIDRVVDISAYMDAKLAAVQAHQSQCAVMSFEDAVRGLNRYRGVMHSGWPPATYAEVFTAMRSRG